MGELEPSNANQSSPWIWVLLLITLGLTAYVSLQEEQDESAVAGDMVLMHETGPRKTVIRQKQPAQTKGISYKESAREGMADKAQESAGIVDWQQLDRTAMAQPKNLFRSSSWTPKPHNPLQQKSVKVAPPPPPKAPPVPFSYMGRLDNGPEGNLVYLAASDKSYSTVIGRNVNSFWRLDKEDDQQLYFTYLPLDLPQTLSKRQGANSVASGTEPAFGKAF